MAEAELRWYQRPQLHRPMMVLGFRGLFDAGAAATGAIEWLAERLPGEVIAGIDPETYFDFTQERPVVRFDDEGKRVIEWPRNELRTAVTPGDQHDLVLLGGVEPHLRWRSFCGLLVSAARELDVEMVVTLGGMVSMTPHTRALSVTGSATNERLAARLGLGRPSYEGPTGVIGTLHDALDTAGVPVISLRVGVPHYVPAGPNPKAVRALLRRFELVTGIETGHAELDGPSASWQQQVDVAVAEDEQIAAYVRQLEQQTDADVDLLPSGDDIAAELEAFLREQRPDD